MATLPQLKKAFPKSKYGLKAHEPHAIDIHLSASYLMATSELPRKALTYFFLEALTEYSNKLGGKLIYLTPHLDPAHKDSKGWVIEDAAGKVVCEVPVSWFIETQMTLLTYEPCESISIKAWIKYLLPTINKH